MAEQFPPENIFNFYGTTTIQSCIKTGGLVPWQVLGLVPCDTSMSKFECGRRNDIIKVPAFNDGFNSFMFEYPTLETIEDFRMQVWNGSTWVFAVTNSGSGQLSDGNEGVLYPLNGGFPNYPEYAGFKIDWGEIYAKNGAGFYRFLAWDSVGGESTSLISTTFILKEATDANKNGTVKISIDSVGEFGNPFYSINNNQRRLWDLINLDETAFPNGWFDECYYYGKVIPTDGEITRTYIRRPNSEHQHKFSDSRENFDLNLWEMDYNHRERLNHYGFASDNVRISDCNKDSPLLFMDDFNITCDEPPTSNVIPNNREMLSTVFRIKPEVSFNYRP